MCLDNIYIVPKENLKGYGFKVVVRTENPDEFTGRWPYFEKGRGGCGNKEKNMLRNGVTWKIGRMYRVKHNRIAHTDSCRERYKAGVHLYRTFSMARCEVSSYNDHNVILVCYYTSAKYRDRTQLVAMRCTPVLALKTIEQREVFESLIKTYGIKDAILVYQKRYAD